MIYFPVHLHFGILVFILDGNINDITRNHIYYKID